jgi:hypothetical protein
VSLPEWRLRSKEDGVAGIDSIIRTWKGAEMDIFGGYHWVFIDVDRFVVQPIHDLGQFRYFEAQNALKPK